MDQQFHKLPSMLPVAKSSDNYRIFQNLLLINSLHFHLAEAIDSQLTLHTSGLSRNNGKKHSMKGNSGSCNTPFKIKYWRNLAQTEPLITYCLNFILYPAFENQFFNIGFWFNKIGILFGKLAVEMHYCENKMTNLQCKLKDKITS